MRFPCWSFVLVDSKSRLETKITRCHGISSFNDERKTFRLTTECVAEYLHFENRPPFIIISSELIFCVLLLLLLLLFFLIPNFNSFVVYTETRLTCYILEITRSCAVCSLRRIMGKPWLRSGPLHSIFATLRTLAYRQAVSDRYTWHLITQWWRKKKPRTTRWWLKLNRNLMKRVQSARLSGHLECIRSRAQFQDIRPSQSGARCCWQKRNTR